MSHDLNILITGSSRGIGKAIAIELAKESHNIILNNDLRIEEGKITLEEIKQYSPKSFLFKADVSEYNQVINMKQYIRKNLGDVNVLINNAGIARDATLKKLSIDDWQKVINTNLNGIFNCTKVFLPEMIENKFGRIINISSVVGFSGNFGQSNYAASKAGIIGFTKSIALEVAKYGITVNAVAPGFVETEMVEQIPKEILDNITNKIPLKRLGHPREIAHAIKFLIDDDSQYITGQTIHVNGGLYM